eukprot:m.143093 g.143093  ORF g.143093 m.143093 type:complete len:51 (-) comp14978_c16_seq6:98-250(-)
MVSEHYPPARQPLTPEQWREALMTEHKRLQSLVSNIAAAFQRNRHSSTSG